MFTRFVTYIINNTQCSVYVNVYDTISPNKTFSTSKK